MPGMIEGHNHLCIDARKSEHLEIIGTGSESKLTLLALEGLYDDLLSGVTTARCMGDKYDLDLKLKKEIEAGNVTGPDLLTAGVGMKGSNGSGDIGAPHSGVEEFRRTARANVGQGRECPQDLHHPRPLLGEAGLCALLPLRRGESRTVVEEGERLHLPVAAHCIGGKALHDCVEQGVAVIEHAYCADQSDIDLLKAHPECWVDLTTGIYLDPSGSPISLMPMSGQGPGGPRDRPQVRGRPGEGRHPLLPGHRCQPRPAVEGSGLRCELGADKRTALKGVTSNAAIVSRVEGKKGILAPARTPM